MNEIIIFGIGCEATRDLEDKIYRAVLKLNLDAVVERVDNINTFIEYELMKTPALMINKEVVLNGEIPDYDQILIILTEKTLSQKQ